MQTIIAALIFPIALVFDDRSGNRWVNCCQGADDVIRSICDLLDTLAL